MLIIGLVVSFPSLADQYLCVPDQFTVFNQMKEKIWEQSNKSRRAKYTISSIQFGGYSYMVVGKLDEDNIFLSLLCKDFSAGNLFCASEGEQGTLFQYNDTAKRYQIARMVLQDDGLHLVTIEIGPCQSL